MRIVIFCVLGGVCGRAASLTLSWDRNPETNIAGYKIYWTDDPVLYPLGCFDCYDVGNTNAGTLTNLAPGRTYWFCVSAYNSQDVESDLSKAITAQLLVVQIERGSQPQGPWKIFRYFDIVADTNAGFFRLRISKD